MNYRIKLPSNYYLISHKNYLIGLKYFDYNRKNNTLYDRDSIEDFEYNFEKKIYNTKEPYLVVSNNLMDTKFIYHINVKTENDLEILKIERNENYNAFIINLFEEKLLEIPFFLDVDVNKTYIIKIPVLFEVKDIVKIMDNNIIVKNFVIAPPDELYSLKFYNNIKFDIYLYDKIYRLLTNNYN